MAQGTVREKAVGWAVAVIVSISLFVIAFSYVANDIYPAYPGPVELLAQTLAFLPDWLVGLAGLAIVGLVVSRVYLRDS